MIEEEKPQSERNDVIEEQANQNKWGYQDKQPVDAINLEVTDHYVKPTEGHDEIHKDAMRLLEFYKFFKEHWNNIPWI